VQRGSRNSTQVLYDDAPVERRESVPAARDDRVVEEPHASGLKQAHAGRMCRMGL